MPRLSSVTAASFQPESCNWKQSAWGQFELRQVDAVVLEEEGGPTEPLLGMSYLGEFRFQINAAENTLKLSRVVAE